MRGKRSLLVVALLAIAFSAKGSAHHDSRRKFFSLCDITEYSEQRDLAS
jgi:hypothetical protein